MTHPIDTIVGERIRDRRNDLNMSLEALAQLVNVGRQQLAKYEKATNRVSASMLFEISKALKVPMSYFFVGLKNHDLIHRFPPHGSPEDRGSADAYYGRGRHPHKLDETGWEKISISDPEECHEYHAGFENEYERKEWEG